MLFSLVLLVLLGFPIAAFCGPVERPLRMLGESFLFGTGVVWFVLLATSLSGGWNRTVIVLIIATIILFVSFPSLWKARRSLFRIARPETRPLPAIVIAAALGLATVTLAGYFVFATLVVPFENDFLAIWGLKARVFFSSGGVDWLFLSREANRYSHPDYPLLWPFLLDFGSMVRGAWSPWGAGVFSAAFGAAGLLVAGDEAAGDSGSVAFAAVVVALLAPLAVSPWVGLAEAPLVAFITASGLALRRGIRADHERSFLAAGLLAGMAGCVKNEGLAWMAALILAMLAVRIGWARIRSFSWGLLIPLPWMVLRVVHRLPTDLFEGNRTERIAARLVHPFEVLGPLAAHLPARWPYWAGLLLAILIGGRALRAERLILCSIGLLALFYGSAYFISAYDPAWHIATSAERLWSHLLVLLTFVVLMSLQDLRRSLGGRPSR